MTARDHRTHLMAHAQAPEAAVERARSAEPEAARAGQREAMAGGVLLFAPGADFGETLDGGGDLGD